MGVIALLSLWDSERDPLADTWDGFLFGPLGLVYPALIVLAILWLASAVVRWFE